MYYPYGVSIIPTSSKPCEDCLIKSNDVDIRAENGDYLPIGPFLLKTAYLCNSCAKNRQETVVTPCMKL